MNLIKCYQTTSSWYKGAVKNSKPVGILWHDTGAGNSTIKRYVQPSDNAPDRQEMLNLIGVNKYGNDWNHKALESGLNAWIGKLADGSVATVQAGDWTMTPWGCGSGKLGSCNGYVIVDGVRTYNGQHWIQFEICDDGYKDKQYFDAVYKEACELTAYLCKEFDIDPFGTVNYNGATVPTILCHADSYKLKLGGNHGDVYSWFGKMGLAKNMDKVRKDVAALMNVTTDTPKEEPVVFEVGDTVKIRPGVTTFYNGVGMASWVPSKTLYVRKVTGNKIQISTVKTGAVTGTVWDTDLILIEKANKEVVETPKVEVTPEKPEVEQAPVVEPEVTTPEEETQPEVLPPEIEVVEPEVTTPDVEEPEVEEPVEEEVNKEGHEDVETAPEVTDPDVDRPEDVPEIEESEEITTSVKKKNWIQIIIDFIKSLFRIFKK